MRRTWACWACAWLAGGCGGDARVEFSAADVISAVAGQMERTVEEYHQEVSRFDDTRESTAVAAFVARVRQDSADEAAVEAHAADFESALRRIRQDRQTEWARRNAALENVDALREVSRGMRKLAIQSLGLQDELQRYLTGWIEAYQRQHAGANNSVKVETRLED
ncbi:MAG TPA: hypothetical protein PKG54_18115 [Phycisphaerae bacterium]|jgi:Asp-tRNA(Asn)/Glu-tRNA(Gln) amidotransferase C subunit|nr:hypothetical protein [Phycisphaerae bacterium]HOB76430.1 hypothetical protein [Phycisphaerae bacterium]HOJ56904.1 hypothetical protein [Phycisphaerae bacterium]HOL28479.1 hypothetical protein [Phycisphaerae bacterium]HPP22990.1 hypothetical protein [Phycisphaerae bacterium]